MGNTRPLKGRRTKEKEASLARKETIRAGFPFLPGGPVWEPKDRTPGDKGAKQLGREET